MKKSTLKRIVNYEMCHVSFEKRDRILATLEKFEARIGGRKGAEDARDRFHAFLKKLYRKPQPQGHYTAKQRHDRWVATQAEELAAMAGILADEHGVGYASGDYHTVSGRDFIPAHESSAAPYHDMGGAGLGLVAVERTRVYAKASKWRPSTVTTYFLVGRNEIGTYFSHPVTPCETVQDALSWIWNGKEMQILQRQGDIALIQGNGGPRMPRQLPWGHRVDEEKGIVEHSTHAALPLPKKGQRIIVGRRASDRAIAASRD